MSGINYIFSVIFFFLTVYSRNGSDIYKGFNAIIGNVANDNDIIKNVNVK